MIFQADSWLKASEYMGMLRNEAIKELELLKGKEEELAFCFVVGATHHPFTKPRDEDIPFVKQLAEKVARGEELSSEERTQLLEIKSDTYDIVLNGYEL